jgi:hypothetical protein
MLGFKAIVFIKINYLVFFSSPPRDSCHSDDRRNLANQETAGADKIPPVVGMTSYIGI